MIQVHFLFSFFSVGKSGRNQRLTQLLENSAELWFSAAKALKSNEVCDEKEPMLLPFKCLHSGNGWKNSTSKVTAYNIYFK